MAEGTKTRPWGVVVCAAISVIGLEIFLTEGAVAQTSEIDSYDRAVTSQNKENALAFLGEFRSSHLVVDLIESLRPDVAREAVPICRVASQVRAVLASSCVKQ